MMTDSISSHQFPAVPSLQNVMPFTLHELQGTAHFVLQAPLQQLGVLPYNGRLFGSAKMGKYLSLKKGQTAGATVRRTGPDSFQWCPATGQGAMGTN